MDTKEKERRERRLERFALRAMQLVKVADADLLRLDEGGRAVLAQQTAFDAMQIADAMENEFEKRMMR